MARQVTLACSYCRRTSGFPCVGCGRRTCSDCHLGPKHMQACEKARREAGQR